MLRLVRHIEMGHIEHAVALVIDVRDRVKAKQRTAHQDARRALGSSSQKPLTARYCACCCSSCWSPRDTSSSTNSVLSLSAAFAVEVGEVPGLRHDQASHGSKECALYSFHRGFLSKSG